ncbi:MAG: glycosyltransferase [Proteobacteria bacterium]|nr:glycosyltransferase [Pseudomonadota bacterium]
MSNKKLLELAQKRYILGNVAELPACLEAESSFRKWKDEPCAICFYGTNQYARNVQVRGLADASQYFGIPFYAVYRDQEYEFSNITKQFKNLLIITNLALVTALASYMKDVNYRIVLIGQYYDETPDERLAPKVSVQEKSILQLFRKDIALVISEFSGEGSMRYMYGYVKKFGIPVMSFPWAVNLNYHFPYECGIKKDVIFIGTYSEKAQRIDSYFSSILRKYPHTVIGPDWSKSPFRWISNSIIDIKDFNVNAPLLYSSHTVSLNIHLPFEESGYSCNERVFNSVACGGFQICDNPRRLKDYFTDEELVTADSPKEYFDKAAYFVQNPDERYPFMERSLEKMYSFHTYHHRLSDLLNAVFARRSLSNICYMISS